MDMDGHYRGPDSRTNKFEYLCYLRLEESRSCQVLLRLQTGTPIPFVRWLTSAV